ncbi:MAG: sensor histidine kinase [Halioglobus sp.]
MPHVTTQRGSLGRLNDVVAIWVLFFSSLVTTIANAVELEPGRHYRQLSSDILFEISALGTDSSPDEIFSRVPTHFSGIAKQQIDFGFQSETIWLYLPVSNQTGAESDRILSLNTRFMNELVVYLRVDGAITKLMHNSERSHFHERPINYRLLAAPFKLRASTRAELLIGYRSNGTSYLPISIETIQSFADSRILSNTKNGGFYTAAALMFLYSLFQLFLPGNKIHLHYILYLAAATLYVFHMDGLTFQYFWPDYPQLNAHGSLPLGLLINIMAASFSRQFLETWKTAPRMDAAILAMIAASLVLILFGSSSPEPYIKRLAFWLTSGGALLYLWAGIHALTLGRRSARFYVTGWIGICSASIFSSIIHTIPAEFPVSLSFDLTKGGILFDALMFGMAMADRSSILRQERDNALAEKMSALTEQAKVREELVTANRGREDAISIAKQRNLQLATASHDIRQPLSSLKMALKSMKSGGPVGGAGESSTAIDSVEYLEALVTNYLDTTKEEFLLSSESEEAVLNQEEFPVQLILDSVFGMFENEALAKGLALTQIPCSLRVKGNALATIRILSNLVSNAVQYTRSGRVLVGCRRHLGVVVFWVCDTGKGISEEEKDQLLETFSRGKQSESESDGYGLGLHIVATLCAKNAYSFDVDSVLGKGTTVKVTLARSDT